MKEFSGYYCPHCLDKCTGYTNSFGQPHCIVCDSKMKLIQKEVAWGIIANHHAIRPVNDRVLIIQDSPKTRYDCKTCKGKGHTDETCEHCLGTGKEPRKKYAGKFVGEEELCRQCVIRGELDRAYGKIICPACKGAKGTIIVPDNQVKPPLTGNIIAIGSEVKWFAVGMKVIFTNYTGTPFQLDGVNVIFACEKDIIGEYKQIGDTNLTDGIKENVNVEPANIGVDSTIGGQRGN